MRFNCEYNGVDNQLTFTAANDGAHIDIEYKRGNKAELQVQQFHIDKIDATALGLALLEYAGREDALKFACRELAVATSKDGSGHADVAVKALEMAGYTFNSALEQVNVWKESRAWKPGQKAADFDFADAEKRLASLILQVVNVYNDGFDIVAASKAQTAAMRERKIVDYSQFQNITLKDACTATCPGGWADPVYYMLFSAWNDTIDWAEKTANLDKPWSGEQE